MERGEKALSPCFQKQNTDERTEELKHYNLSFSSSVRIILICIAIDSTMQKKAVC